MVSPVCAGSSKSGATASLSRSGMVLLFHVGQADAALAELTGLALLVIITGLPVDRLDPLRDVIAAAEILERQPEGGEAGVEPGRGARRVEADHPDLRHPALGRLLQAQAVVAPRREGQPEQLAAVVAVGERG